MKDKIPNEISINILITALPSVTLVSAQPVIIGFNGEPNEALLENHGARNISYYNLIKAGYVDLPASAIQNLKKNPHIKYVEPDILVHALGRPSSQPPQQLTWGINLVGKKKGRNYNDDNGHGTHVAGIVAASNNNIGVVGVAPDAQLYAVKALDKYGGGYISDIIEAIEWAVLNNMSIISMSLGTSRYSQALEEVCDAAYANGVLLIAAAGNSGDGNAFTDEVMYPAKFDSVIAVGAINRNDTTLYFSASGPEVELVAPGVEIYSTWPRDTYAYASGTSMAAPFVTGMAALYWSENKTLSNSELRELLRNTALDLGEEGKDNVYGYGLVLAK
ncbi:S8 family peptidase [Candidatus Pyrohabitans sp.]